MSMQSVLGMGHFFMGAFLSCLYYPPSLATGGGGARRWTLLPRLGCN